MSYLRPRPLICHQPYLSGPDAKPAHRGERVRHGHRHDLNLLDVNSMHLRQSSASRPQHPERKRFVQDQPVAVPWVENFERQRQGAEGKGGERGYSFDVFLGHLSIHHASPSRENNDRASKGGDNDERDNDDADGTDKRGAGGCTHFIHSRSRTAIDPRALTMPARDGGGTIRRAKSLDKTPAWYIFHEFDKNTYILHEVTQTSRSTRDQGITRSLKM